MPFLLIESPFHWYYNNRGLVFGGLSQQIFVFLYVLRVYKLYPFFILLL